jgi:hypothetical protein
MIPQFAAALKSISMGRVRRTLQHTFGDAPIEGLFASDNVFRREGFAKDELCGLTGSFVYFAKTEQDRLAVGDSRFSLTERFGTR